MFEKVIFLDIDGVLNGENSKSCYITEDGRTCSGIDKDKVQRLAAIVKVTGADLVLSSSWKEDWFQHCGFLFKEAGLSKHAKYLTKHLYRKGKLVLRDRTPSSFRGRGYEIKFWLRTHPQTKAWVILDDENWPDFYEYDEVWRHWVKTDEKAGLTEKDATAAIQILQGHLIDPIEKTAEELMEYYNKDKE